MSNSKVVVVTGVSSGIGRVTAEKFAKRGCRVFGTVRNTAKAQSIPGVVLVGVIVLLVHNPDLGVMHVMPSKL